MNIRKSKTDVITTNAAFNCISKIKTGLTEGAINHYTTRQEARRKICWPWCKCFV